MKASRKQKRVYELFVKAAGMQTSTNDGTVRELPFVFFRNPAEISSNDGSRVAGVKLEKTILQGGFFTPQHIMDLDEIHEKRALCMLIIHIDQYDLNSSFPFRT